MSIAQRKNPYHMSKFKNALLTVLVLALHTCKKFSKIYLDIHSRDKSVKNGIFDVVTSCFEFDMLIYFLRKYFLMPCY